ncbi:MAG: hypothetical protein ACT4NY_22720, partial [Pseudonocardiales bacterium]
TQPDLVVSNDPLEAVNALDIPVYEAALYCQQGSGGADAVVDAVVTDPPIAPCGSRISSKKSTDALAEDVFRQRHASPVPIPPV